ncbi:alpha/beta hydrolase [Sphingomonas sp. TREG-RG-20F-R18-01]|uniref:alpha/beta hydrolase n=1 Tax=Sphingomonas sp. TREG-RG-20F-R18-01 TaxID=2914982 RepID=UPI001F55BAC6|nr:alpha/beta hydrolase [Sphingomonas sp. TREG-RG-20F-R18-01]
MDLRASETAVEPQAILVRVDADTLPPSSIEQVVLDLSKFHNGRWALQLDAAFAHRDTSVVILAQGLACLAVSWWAQLSPRSYLRSVRGAVFDSPLSIDLHHVAAAASIRTGPIYRLPFPSIVVSDTTFQVEEVLALADKWGSQFVATAPATVGDPTNRHARSDVAEMLLSHARLLERAPAGQPRLASLTVPDPTAIDRAS